jgi:hypothetical protein
MSIVVKCSLSQRPFNLKLPPLSQNSAIEKESVTFTKALSSARLLMGTIRYM